MKAYSYSSENYQSNSIGFLKGRQSIGNVILAVEALKFIRSNKSSSSCLGIKIDLSKAFDRVEWDLILCIMQACGFSPKWYNLIKHFMPSTKISVLPYGILHPSRRIRQGDPLSPYLFLLVGEILCRLLSQAEKEPYVR